MTRFSPLTAATLLATTIGCGIAGIGGPDRQVLLVQHHRAECQGEALFLCLLVWSPGDSAYRYFYGSIESFTFEWGYHYELEVDRHRIENPPADGSSIRTVLVNVRAKERVASGTEFDLVLTPGNGRVVELAEDHYAFYSSAEFVCAGDASCPELRARLAAEGRVKLRLAHPVSPDDPLTIVRWTPCDLIPSASPTVCSE